MKLILLAGLGLLMQTACHADGLLQNGDTTHPIVLFAASTSDGQTGVTGLTLALTISKNGGALAAPTGTVTEIGSGFYKYQPSGADDGTDGELVVNATGTGAFINPERRRIIAVNPDDPALLGLTNVGTLSGQNTISAKTSLIGTNAADSPNAITAQSGTTSNGVAVGNLNTLGTTGAGFKIASGQSTVASNFVAAPTAAQIQAYLDTNSTQLALAVSQTSPTNQTNADIAALQAQGYTVTRAGSLDNIAAINTIVAKFVFDSSNFVKANTQVLPATAPAGYGGSGGGGIGGAGVH